MANYPFTTLLKELTEALTTTAEHGPITSPDLDNAEDDGGADKQRSDTTPTKEQHVTDSSTQLVSATNNLIKHQVAYVEEGADEIK